MNRTTIIPLVAIISTIGLFTVSCEKEDNTIGEETVFEYAFNAPEEFSIILSKAVSDNKSLREFIKNEASKQFDKDYDVFYPYVKDMLVDGNNTFIAILKNYDDNDALERIEGEMPLLNILVPDWSWADGFSLNTWDTNDNDVSVAFDTMNGALQLYNNGEREYLLEYGQLSEFPILIVKENERMRKAANTKASVLSYEFIDPEFDGTGNIQTKVDHNYYDRIIETEDYSNFVTTSEMIGCTSAINAYSIFANNPSAVHRDHIYYGMTDEIMAGKLNVHVTEYITKFRFGSLDSEFMFDGDDFSNCPESYTRYVEISDNTLINKFYYDGNLELYFQICVGNADGTTTVIPKYKTVSFTDAFQLSKVHVDFKHRTWFSDRKWVFTVDKKCFVPKWVNAEIQLPKWDISSQSTIINIHVSEYDNETEETRTISIVNSFTNNFTGELEVGATLPIETEIGNINASGKIKLGYGETNKDETTQTVSIKTKKGSDDLGTALLYYSDPVVLSEASLNGKSGYRIKEINTGFVYMLVLPKYE